MSPGLAQLLIHNESFALPYALSLQEEDYPYEIAKCASDRYIVGTIDLSNPEIVINATLVSHIFILLKIHSYFYFFSD